ncbi:restriction endonuclease [Marinobacter adhaerens]|mgnify:CR=1 FL=1|uniref:Restriction endonuclease n=2 Tax=Marinobacter adhaerens TaxID=1033846 RepID=A0ABX8IKK4_9GAMM|nr:restriction endonuclease [Marinobacter adhaerens]MBW4977753.1 restriction endonuclease [Marinobacter adhaerens]QWV13323.1 restriction endonuclease [Marinobacter adhaerens]
MADLEPNTRRKKRRRKGPPVPEDMKAHRKLARSAAEKLHTGQELTERELIAVFKTDSLNEDELEAVVDQLAGGDAEKLLEDFRYLEEPKIVTDCLSLWCPDVEAEMLAYFRRHPEQLYSLPPRKFEELVASIFRNNGFSVELTPQSRDGGVDIVAVEESNFVGRSVHLIECKRYAPDRSVGIGVVQRLLGTVTQARANKGVVVTTSFFTKDAQAVADETKHILTLRDYDHLIAWLSTLQLPGNR